MKDVIKLTKDDLQAYAESGEDFQPVTLDLRKSIDTLRAQVLSLQPKKEAAVKEDEPAKPVATHIKNKKTGYCFLKTQALIDHLGDDGVLCDSLGNPV